MQRPRSHMPPLTPGVPQQRVPRSIAPRPVVLSVKPTVTKQDQNAGVQQVEQGLKNLTTGDAVPPVPIGRGAFRAVRRLFDVEHYRIPRQQSSLGAIGKLFIFVIIQYTYRLIL